MEQNEMQSRTQKILTIIGIVMCIVLIPILIINSTLLIKSFVNKNEVPNFAGAVPLIVLSDSMYPDIKSGDLIICQTVNPEEIKEDDVISFYDPAGNGVTVVTHKVVEVLRDNGTLSFRTAGINNNTNDKLPVPASSVIAIYNGVRFAGLGNIAIFMQSTAGLIVCVIAPILLFVGYDVIRRKLYERKKGDDVAALMAELEALKAASAQRDAEAGNAEDEGAATQ